MKEDNVTYLEQSFHKLKIGQFIKVNLHDHCYNKYKCVRIFLINPDLRLFVHINTLVSYL